MGIHGSPVDFDIFFVVSVTQLLNKQSSFSDFRRDDAYVQRVNNSLHTKILARGQ